MTKNENRIDFWGDGMKIFMDYIVRQLKKNPDYEPHPLIKALELALSNVEKVNIGQCVMGVSQNGTKDSVYNPFVVILQKKEADKIEVKAIKNLKVKKDLPLDIMIIIFRIQILLDKIKSDNVSPEQMVECLNKVIPGNRFFALGDKWQEARDNFREALRNGQVSIPKTPEMKKVANELLQITYNTPWEDYSPEARSFIGAYARSNLKDKDGSGIVTITTPKDYKIEKYKVFDMATEFMLGESSKYINLFGKSNDDIKK